MVAGDTQVGVDHINNGDVVWDYTIIFLIFLPNLVFILWFTLANRGHLLEAGTWGMILTAGSVQVVTFMR